MINEENLRFMDVISDYFKPCFGKLPLFSDAELRRLNMPTLLIAGAKDMVFPTEKTAWGMEKLVPQSDVRILSDQGHVLYHLAPAVTPFLLSNYIK